MTIKKENAHVQTNHLKSTECAFNVQRSKFLIMKQKSANVQKGNIKICLKSALNVKINRYL
jgi:hypothetical protein